MPNPQPFEHKRFLIVPRGDSWKVYDHLHNYLRGFKQSEHARHFIDRRILQRRQARRDLREYVEQFVKF